MRHGTGVDWASIRTQQVRAKVEISRDLKQDILEFCPARGRDEGKLPCTRNSEAHDELAREMKLIRTGTLSIAGTKVRAIASKHRATSYGHMKEED